MSLPPPGARTKLFTARDLELIAGEETISVIFDAPTDAIRLTNGYTYGPYGPGEKSSLPLWLGLYLKKFTGIKLIPPVWLSVPALKAALEAESDDQDHLSPLEPRFFEIAHMILTRAADDLPDAAGVRTVLKDLEDYRATKIRRRVADVGRQSDDLFMMRHLTAHELHAHAGMLRVALNGFMAIDHTARDRAGEE